MGYAILCPQRSGSTYLGECLRLNDVPYWNEIFAPPIMRRRTLWPRDLDEAAIRADVRRATEGDGGFKFPHRRDQPGVYAALHQTPGVRILHIFREDLVEQFASWRWLNITGISLAHADGTVENTDGEQWTPDGPQELDPIEIDPVCMELHFASMERFRWLVWFLFRETHPYLEIDHREIFTDAGRRRALAFLGHSRQHIELPDHVPTPRPRARDMFANYDALRAHFAGTPRARYFED
jgi:hypothetical protein